MSDPITQVEVESEILRLSDLLERKTESLAVLGRAAAEAEVAYKRAYAVAYLKAGLERKVPVAEREATATVQTADALLVRRTAEVSYEAAREMCRTIRENLQGLRSLNANIRGMV